MIGGADAILNGMDPGLKGGEIVDAHRPRQCLPHARREALHVPVGADGEPEQALETLEKGSRVSELARVVGIENAGFSQPPIDRLRRLNENRRVPRGVARAAGGTGR